MLNLRYCGLEKQAVFHIENAEHLSFPDQSFHTIFSINVFHHLENPSVVLAEIIRLLHPGGKVVLSDFNDRGLAIINACHTQEGRKHDYCKHHLDEAVEYLLHHGFAIDEFQSEVQRVVIVTQCK
jgi:ubiquinone/menaquinone biosynthesis C-methylase UbiE